MIILDNIHSLTDFKRNTSAYVEKMKDTKAPLVLTVNGEAELVVQSAKAYQELLDRIRQIEEELKRAKQEALQSAIAVGAKQIESGEYVEYSQQSLAALSRDIKARGRRRRLAHDGEDNV
jgi:prevent-host-death family protein